MNTDSKEGRSAGAELLELGAFRPLGKLSASSARASSELTSLWRKIIVTGLDLDSWSVSPRASARGGRGRPKEGERAKERRSSRDRDRERSSIPVAVGRSLRRVADRSSSNILICRRRNDIREREGERDCLFEELSRFRLSNKSGFQFLEHI